MCSENVMELKCHGVTKLWAIAIPRRKPPCTVQSHAPHSQRMYNVKEVATLLAAWPPVAFWSPWRSRKPPSSSSSAISGSSSSANCSTVSSASSAPAAVSPSPSTVGSALKKLLKESGQLVKAREHKGLQNLVMPDSNGIEGLFCWPCWNE